MAGAPQGGAEMAYVDTAIALAEAGHEVAAATRPNSMRVGRLREAGLVVHELTFGGFWDFGTTRELRKVIADFEPVIVQTWMSRASRQTPRWKAASGDPPYVTVARLGGYYKLKYFRNSQYFVVITEKLGQHLFDGGVARDRVRCIKNLAEVEHAEIPVSRAGLGTPEDAVVLLALGRLHKAKAFDILLRALVDLPGVYLWIAGEGPLRAELEQLRGALGLTTRVKFLGWRGDRAALFQAADICVLPSRYEPFGTVLAQAWAQRVPLVTTDADGPSQNVIDQMDGLMVPIEDAAAMTVAIRRVIDDPDLRDHLVRNGYQRYQDEFTKEKMVAGYADFYGEILAKEGLVETQAVP
jgi:glycosyltransferase involved in cell wall biosynthesis